MKKEKEESPSPTNMSSSYQGYQENLFGKGWDHEYCCRSNPVLLEKIKSKYSL